MKAPPAHTVFAWLRANLGKRAPAPLTSTDARALAAAVQVIELYSYHRDDVVLEAFATCVLCMQPHTRELAYHGIAHVMDWNDRDVIWTKLCLPRPEHFRVCAFEPRALAQQANPIPA